jgi:hypothetical protein
MNTSEGSADLGDVENRCRIKPLVVAGALLPDSSGGSDHGPFALLLTVDVDSVPGFREIIERQRGGEEFDVVSRWGAAMDKSGEHAPLAIVDFYLPEFELGIAIEFDVDEHPNSILAAIQSGLVFVLDTETYERLQMADESGALLDELRPFSVQPTDPRALIAVMQQRFNMPLQRYEPERVAVTDENRDELITKLFADARPVRGIGISVRGDGPATIILVDPDSASLREKIPDDAKVEGRWGVFAGENHSVTTLDIFANGRQIGHWVLPEMSEEAVRAGSNGAHWVAIVTELDTDDREKFEKQMREAISAWVTHVEALRSLRFAGGDSV